MLPQKRLPAIALPVHNTQKMHSRTYFTRHSRIVAESPVENGRNSREETCIHNRPCPPCFIHSQSPSAKHYAMCSSRHRDYYYYYYIFSSSSCSVRHQDFGDAMDACFPSRIRTNKKSDSICLQHDRATTRRQCSKGNNTNHKQQRNNKQQQNTIQQTNPRASPVTPKKK